MGVGMLTPLYTGECPLGANVGVVGSLVVTALLRRRCSKKLAQT